MKIISTLAYFRKFLSLSFQHIKLIYNSNFFLKKKNPIFRKASRMNSRLPDAPDNDRPATKTEWDLLYLPNLNTPLILMFIYSMCRRNLSTKYQELLFLALETSKNEGFANKQKKKRK
jgi:hypothetical protein